MAQQPAYPPARIAEYLNPEAETYRLAVQEYRRACESKNPARMVAAARALNRARQALRSPNRVLTESDS